MGCAKEMQVDRNKKEIWGKKGGNLGEEKRELRGRGNSHN